MATASGCVRMTKKSHVWPLLPRELEVDRAKLAGAQHAYNPQDDWQKETQSGNPGKAQSGLFTRCGWGSTGRLAELHMRRHETGNRVRLEVPAFSVQAAACAEASEASSQRDNTYVLVCAELKLVCTSKNAQTASPEACHGTRWEPRSCILVFNWPVKQPSATLLRELLREVYHQASKLRRYALHSRGPDGEATLPQRDNTYVLVWVGVWFAPQRMLTRRRLRPVMERAGHHEVASMFSIDLSNNVAKLLRKLFREMYHQASEALRVAFPRPDEEAFPARRWGGISHHVGRDLRRAFFSSGRGGMKLMSEKALKKCFLHPDEESQMGGCVRDLSVIASIQRERTSSSNFSDSKQRSLQSFLGKGSFKILDLNLKLREQ